MAASPAAVPIISVLAGASLIAKYRWKDRGLAPRGYIKGMALLFGRVYCKLKAGDAGARIMAKPVTGHPHKDALAHYDAEFKGLGWSNAHGGPDTLRHLFVLMVGLGMRESGGNYDEGRDMSAANNSASTAEAGLFQMSYNARGFSPYLMDRLLNQYAGQTGFLDIFREGTRHRSGAPVNWGGGMGQEFQRRCKECPGFAVESTAVILRYARRHWGPINMKTAELRRDCDDLLRSVQAYIDANGITAI